MNDLNSFYEKFKDPHWRLTNLYMIVDKEGNKIKFRENQVQKRINQSTSQRKMILKARQFGVTTNETIKLLDWVLFTPNAKAAIIAHKQDAIETIFRIPRLAYENMPEHLKPRLSKGGGSIYEMYFPELNSRIYCDLEVRGGTIGRLHVSEAAFMKDSSKLKATLQAVPITTGQVTIETTPNGISNYFYDMWTDHDSIYEKLFFPWYIFPDYKIKVDHELKLKDEEELLISKAKRLYDLEISKDQLAFRRLKKSELKTSFHDKTRVTFEQEYPEDDQTCFLASGDAVLDLFSIKRMIDTACKPLVEENGIKIYKQPIKTKRYTCGADPAEGIKKDFSVAIMIDNDTKEIVAVARGQWKPSLFADVLFDFCKKYSSANNYPLLAVERNNHGHAVLLSLDEILSYPNIYVNPKDERIGWKTDMISRPIMMNGFIDAIENDILKINDLDVLNECLTLVDNSGKIEASQGKHDDCITASAIALQVSLSNSLSVYEDIRSKIRV
jgi:hypothetical protein